MRYLSRFLGICTLAVVPVLGCGDPCEGVECFDSNECTIDTCVDGACEFLPVEDGAACTDGNECTVDACADGACESTPVEDGAPCAADDNECTAETCASGVCQSTPVEDGTPCRAAFDECTVEACASGVCESTPVEDGTACEDLDGNECSVGVCETGTCDATPVMNGTACGDGAGTCQDGSCEVACTEQGIRDAVAVGGGPYTFACDGQRRIVTEAEIVIDRYVILDGEGNLTIDGNESHRVFNAPGRGVTATLGGMTITGGYISGGNGGGISNGGALMLDGCTITGNTARNTGDLLRGHGGGIYNTGTVTLTDSRVVSNRAIASCDCNILCICTGGWGDGIANEGGRVTLVDSTVDDIRSWDGGTHTWIETGSLDYAEDFESLLLTSPTALSDYDWLIFGQLFRSNGALRFTYGPYPAPNGGAAFSAVVTGEGGPDQGAQQLRVYSDYNCCDEPNQGHFNGTDIVVSSVYQEPLDADNPIADDHVGKTLEFSFDAKRGDINDPEGSSTALAFIQTIDPSAGFSQTNFVTVDMTNVGTTWERYSISLAIDESLVGQMLEYGFMSTASNFEPSGVLYDNIIAREIE